MTQNAHGNVEVDDILTALQAAEESGYNRAIASLRMESARMAVTQSTSALWTVYAKAADYLQGDLGKREG